MLALFRCLTCQIAGLEGLPAVRGGRGCRGPSVLPCDRRSRLASGTCSVSSLFHPSERGRFSCGVGSWSPYQFPAGQSTGAGYDAARLFGGGVRAGTGMEASVPGYSRVPVSRRGRGLDSGLSGPSSRSSPVSVHVAYAPGRFRPGIVTSGSRVPLPYEFTGGML